MNVNKDKDSLIADIQKTLDDDFKLWYPLCIDTVYGGFFSDINYKWQLEGAQNKNDCFSGKTYLVCLHSSNVL